MYIPLWKLSVDNCYFEISDFRCYFLDINKGKTDLAYNRRLPDRCNLLRHRQRGLRGHEQCRMCLFHGDVSYVYRHDAYNINM